MRVASQSERLIIVLRVMLGIACQGYPSSQFILIYSLYIVVGEDLIWDVIFWKLQKKLAPTEYGRAVGIWALRLGLVIFIRL